MIVSRKRHIAILMVLAYGWSLVGASVVRAQSPECGFDKSNPSIDNARTSFQIFDFECAEQELQALLQRESLSVEEKANAHMLLAAVYYEMFQDENQRRSKILTQFTEAFKSYREWRGELDIQSPEFRSLMEEARAAVETDEKPVDKPTTEAPTITREPVASSDTKSSGNKKWLLIGLGAAVVVGGVALAAGGGGGDGDGNATALPGFPDHPANP